MTTKEAAQQLGIKPVTVRYLINQGVLEAEKRGRDWYVFPASVEAAHQRSGKWINRKEAQSKK